MSNDGDDKLSNREEAARDTVLPALEAQRKEALDKARIAQGMLDKALLCQSHGNCGCNARYCINKHASKANVKVRTSSTFYSRSRDKLVEAYGGALPDALAAELPPVGRC